MEETTRSFLKCLASCVAGWIAFAVTVAVLVYRHEHWGKCLEVTLQDFGWIEVFVGIVSALFSATVGSHFLGEDPVHQKVLNKRGAIVGGAAFLLVTVAFRFFVISQAKVMDEQTKEYFASTERLIVRTKTINEKNRSAFEAKARELESTYKKAYRPWVGIKQMRLEYKDGKINVLTDVVNPSEYPVQLQGETTIWLKRNLAESFIDPKPAAALSRGYVKIPPRGGFHQIATSGGQISEEDYQKVQRGEQFIYYSMKLAYQAIDGNDVYEDYHFFRYSPLTKAFMGTPFERNKK